MFGIFSYIGTLGMTAEIADDLVKGTENLGSDLLKSLKLK